MKLPDIDVVIQAIGQDTSSAFLSRLLVELEIGEGDVLSYPFNLAGRRLWADHVRERLAALNAGHAMEMGLSGEVDIWCINALGLAVDFSGPDDSIRCIAVGVPIDRSDHQL